MSSLFVRSAESQQPTPPGFRPPSDSQKRIAGEQGVDGSVAVRILLFLLVVGQNPVTGHLDLLKMKSFFISGFFDTLDWRPLYFQESSVAHIVCSLCGVVSRNVVRLPCEHILCSECHEDSKRRGSTCPLDEGSFADDNILHLDISGGYILNHTVACGNAPNGCDFLGQASTLLDHYKQCSFHVVPCPRVRVNKAFGKPAIAPTFPHEQRHGGLQMPRLQKPIGARAQP
ncbi:TNF receptor-associated factor 5-like isoform X2 [Ixodes scapularis]